MSDNRFKVTIDITKPPRGINPDLPTAMARTAFIDAAEAQALAHGALL